MLSPAGKIILWSSNLWSFAMGMLGPLYAVFAQEIGGDILDLTWAYAAYLISLGLGILVVGKLGDRMGHEKLLIAGFVLSTFTAFSYLLVDSVPALLLVQLFLGIATALIEPTGDALYSKHFKKPEHDGYVWGLFSGLEYVFEGIAVIAGGYIVALYSFDALFIIMGTLLAISTVYQTRILQHQVAG